MQNSISKAGEEESEDALLNSAAFGRRGALPLPLPLPVPHRLVSHVRGGVVVAAAAAAAAAVASKSDVVGSSPTWSATLLVQ